jgi:hypothetical protein
MPFEMNGQLRLTQGEQWAICFACKNKCYYRTRSLNDCELMRKKKELLDKKED